MSGYARAWQQRAWLWKPPVVSGTWPLEPPNDETPERAKPHDDATTQGSHGRTSVRGDGAGGGARDALEQGRGADDAGAPVAPAGLPAAGTSANTPGSPPAPRPPPSTSLPREFFYKGERNWVSIDMGFKGRGWIPGIPPVRSWRAWWTIGPCLLCSKLVTSYYSENGWTHCSLGDAGECPYGQQRRYERMLTGEWLRRCVEEWHPDDGGY